MRIIGLIYSVQSSHLTLATGTITMTRSPLASSTPTSGSAHVLAEREAGKASTGISVCMVGKKTDPAFFPPMGKYSSTKTEFRCWAAKKE